jgi:hypothetical protein
VSTEFRFRRNGFLTGQTSLNFIFVFFPLLDPSQYSDWLQTGRSRCKSLIPGRGNFFPLSVIEIGSGARPDSYPMVTGGFFSGDQSS